MSRYLDRFAISGNLTRPNLQNPQNRLDRVPITAKAEPAKPTEPTKPGFAGFDGSIPGTFPEYCPDAATPHYSAVSVALAGKEYLLEPTVPLTLAEVRERMTTYAERHGLALGPVFGLIEKTDETGNRWRVGDVPLDPTGACPQCNGVRFWYDGDGWRCGDCAPEPPGYRQRTGAAFVLIARPASIQAAVLRDMGIEVYRRRPIAGPPTEAGTGETPDFALSVQSGPTAASGAGELLRRFGYAVRYLREPEAARRAIANLLEARHQRLGLDVETMSLPAYRLDAKAGLDPYKGTIRLCQIADPSGTVYVFDLLHLPPELLVPLMAIPLIAHNATFEYRFLKRLNLVPDRLHDSMLLSRVATGHCLSLADAAQGALGLTIDKTLQASAWHTPDLSPAQVDYAALDAVLALRLWDGYGPAIRATGQGEAYKRFARAIPAVAQQMLDGIPFDAASHRRLADGWRAEVEPLRARLAADLGQINPDSGPQLGAWLEKTLDARTLKAWPKTSAGQLKTDAEVIASIDHPAIRTLQRYKVLAKNISTYGEGFAAHIHPLTGRIHADFQIAGTRGGRFRCRNPNVQNPPRDSAFRSLFKAPEGYQLVVADYSQVELRIAAILANDKVMLDAYARGDDLHRKTAATVAGIAEAEVSKPQRQLAKACNFGLIYGMGARGLAAYASSSYGVNMALEQAEQARRAFFATYSGIALWHAKTKVRGSRDATVRTVGGLVRDFSREPRGWQFTEALNTPVQGSGAECLLETLIRLPAALAGLDAKLIHHVHDEVILEVADRDVEAAKIALAEAMTEGFKALFPDADMPGLVEAHAGPDWASAK